VLNHLTIGRYMLEDYAGAIHAAKRALRTHPDQPLTYRWLIAALGQTGQVETAQTTMRRAAAALAPIPFASYARTRGPWLRSADHERLLEGLRKAGLPD
jgi:hypothetical protein